MVSYQYSYLISDLILLAIWIILFLWRKDIRKEMLLISFIFGFIGMFTDIVFMVDWWHPSTITNTKISIEAFLFGFTLAGIAVIIYEEVFKKKIRIRRVKKKVELKRNLNFLLIISLVVILFFGNFYILKIHSLYASIIAFAFPTLFMWIKRKDLIIDSLISGFLLVIVTFFLSVLVESITPGWVVSAWYLENLSGIIIYKIPLDDLIWVFLAGLFLGPIYEYWQEGRLIKAK